MNPDTSVPSRSKKAPTCGPAALAAIRGVNRKLDTDQDFADAEATVRWCGEVESRLAAAKEHALSQTSSIDILFKAIDGGGFWRLRHAPQTVPLMSLSEALRDRRVQATTAVWLLVNALAMLGVGTLGPQGGIAWEAHVGVFPAGLLAFGLFDTVRPARLPDQPTVH